MDSQTFAMGYRQSPDRLRFYDDTPEILEIMEVPREWASFFDRQLSELLKGEMRDSVQDINDQLDEYEFGWSAGYLDDLIEQTQSLAFFDNKATSIVNELNFHVLSKEFMPMWRHVLTPELHPKITPEEIEAMQTGLATRGVQLKAIKNDALKWQQIEKSPQGLVGALSGQISEIDAPVVMLEIPKEMPHLALLPAPPQFESTHYNTRSADFIIIDTELWHSRGIQVKTYIDSIRNMSNPSEEKRTYRPTRKYDSRFVTLIDGTIDLGNFTVHYTPGKEAVLTSDPGQISVSFLEDHNSPDVAQAKNNIQSRIITDLYK